MEIKAKEIYKIIQDFRELQENNFYNLPLKIILILQNNFSIINNLYTIIKQTEQVILERNNYQNYDKEIEDLMETSFSINPFADSPTESSCCLPASSAFIIPTYIESTLLSSIK